MSTRLHVKYPLFLSDFNEPLIFLTHFQKKSQYQVSSKSVNWKPSCSMWTDKTERQMDMTKLTVAFHNFANVPKNVLEPLA